MEKEFVGENNILIIVNEIGILIIMVRYNIESIEGFRKRVSKWTWKIRRTFLQIHIWILLQNFENGIFW